MNSCQSYRYVLRLSADACDRTQSGWKAQPGQKDTHRWKVSGVTYNMSQFHEVSHYQIYCTAQVWIMVKKYVTFSEQLLQRNLNSGLTKCARESWFGLTVGHSCLAVLLSCNILIFLVYPTHASCEITLWCLMLHNLQQLNIVFVRVLYDPVMK
jgi:hypothetical protein